jgi:integral membrane protein
MLSVLQTGLGRLRVVSLVEGLSYLVLLFIAMPLKYIANDPTWVQLFGRVHGGLFVLFVIALVGVGLSEESESYWGWKPAAIAFGLSLIPFGAFVFEKYARGLEKHA